MTRGSGIADQIRSGTRSGTTPRPSASLPEAEDNETFVDDGVADAGPATSLPPAGPVERPNGQVYQPRTIGGFEDVAFLRDCQALSEHVLLYGPPGTGKTALADGAYFADAVRDEAATVPARFVHMGFESIVCSVDTSEADFFGTFVQDPSTGNFQWAPGPLQRAVEFGIPLYVDEVFLCDSRVLSSTLYPLMDGRAVLRIPMNPTLEPIPVQAGFFVVGAGNPDVPGADYSEALRSRFVHQIEVTTDWSLARSLGVPQNIITVAKSLDIKRREGIITWSPQMRDLLLYRATEKRRGRAFALAGLLGKCPFEDRVVVQEALSAKFSAVTHLSMGGPAPKFKQGTAEGAKDA